MLLDTKAERQKALSIINLHQLCPLSHYKLSHSCCSRIRSLFTLIHQPCKMISAFSKVNTQVCKFKLQFYDFVLLHCTPQAAFVLLLFLFRIAFEPSRFCNQKEQSFVLVLQ